MASQAFIGHVEILVLSLFPSYAEMYVLGGALNVVGFFII